MFSSNNTAYSQGVDTALEQPVGTVLKFRPHATVASSAPSGIGIRLANLSKQFGELAVLTQLQLTIEPGAFVAIVGRSGCGKSTLLRLISGLEQPSQGAVYFDGQVHDSLNSDARFMFQESRLLPWRNALDNVRLGLSKNQATKALEALRQVGLESRATAWPSVLSGGQKQRVALARSLVHEPRLLLLDEPLGALDALTRIEMQDLIERIWQENRFTAILVTHDIAEAVALADRVIVLDGGRIDLDLAIDLPRPRQRGDAQLAALEADILQRILARPNAA